MIFSPRWNSSATSVFFMFHYIFVFAFLSDRYLVNCWTDYRISLLRSTLLDLILLPFSFHESSSMIKTPRVTISASRLLSTFIFLLTRPRRFRLLHTIIVSSSFSFVIWFIFPTHFVLFPVIIGSAPSHWWNSSCYFACFRSRNTFPMISLIEQNLLNHWTHRRTVNMEHFWRPVKKSKQYNFIPSNFNFVIYTLKFIRI